MGFSGFRRYSLKGLAVILIGAVLSSCGGEVLDLATLDGETVDMNKRETIFGGDLLTFGGEPEHEALRGGSGVVGVNAFLWRASLDVISSWPVSSADPFGGVIITDWYAPPETPRERFKFNIFILGRALRADGVRVSIFKQILNARGEWQQAALKTATQTLVENSILTRAQQFRAESLK